MACDGSNAAADGLVPGVVLPDAAVPDAVPRVVTHDPTFLPADPPGDWYAGDLHVHSTGASNDTGGDSFPADIARLAQVRGLSFVVLTDHSNSTGSDTETTVEDPALFNQGPEFPYWGEVAHQTVPGRFLMVDGNEISPLAAGDAPVEPRGHIGCIPADLATFNQGGAFIDRPRGPVTGGDALSQARERGCFTIVNHPYGLAPWIRYDWTDMGYDALEVWNGGAGLDRADWLAHDTWRCDLLAGRAVTPIASSDNHRVRTPPPGEVLHPALGWPSTEVYLTELTWPAVVQALRAGHVSMHEGDSRVYLTGYDDGWVRLRGRLDQVAPEDGVLRLVHATACVDPRPDTRPVTLTEAVLYEQPVMRGEAFDVAVPVEGEGVFTARLLPGAGLRYGALSGAVTF